MTITIIKPKLADNRQDSFWYDGQVATITDGKNTISIEAQGEIRVQLGEDDNYMLDGKEARKEALKRKMLDVDLNLLNAFDGWQNNNWFAFYWIENDEYKTDISYEYDNAIETAKNILEELAELKNANNL
jgi:hypothetical protein